MTGFTTFSTSGWVGNHQNDDVIYEWVLSELPCNLSTCKHSWNTLKDPYNTNNWGCRGSWSWSRSPAVGRWSRDPLFLGSIWTQIWTWLDSNPVFGFYGVEIFIKYAGILFTNDIIILGGGGGSRAMMILMTQGGGGGPELAKSWWRNIWTLPYLGTPGQGQGVYWN